MVEWSSPLVIAAIAAALVTVIGAFFAGLTSFLAAWRTVAAKVSAIEGHVNSEATAAKGREALLLREAELLREMIDDQKRIAALLAQQAVVEAAISRTNQPGAAVVTPIQTSAAPQP